MPPLSGVGRYTEQLLLDLFHHADIESIEGFIDFKMINHQNLLELTESLDKKNKTNIRQSTLSNYNMPLLKAIAKHLPFSMFIRQQIQSQLFKNKFKHYQDFIYWESNYILAPFDGYTVATIYDLSHIRHPEFHPLERTQWMDSQLPKTIKNADALTTISEFSKQEIMDCFNVPEDKISIVSPAVSSIFRYPYSEIQKQNIKQQFSLPEQYILSVGTLEPRKNIKGLVQAYSQLSPTLRDAFPLVIVGAKGWRTQETEHIIAPFLKKGQIIMLGYVAQQELPILYAAATLFVYLSYYEGYGMPIAEAMCSNTAVLCSNTTSMPEVSANSTQLVDPNDIDTISEQLTELLEDKNKRENLQKKAQYASANYCWEHSTEQLLQVFKKASI